MYSQWQRMFIGRPIKRRMCCLFCFVKITYINKYNNEYISNAENANWKTNQEKDVLSFFLVRVQIQIP